MLKPVSIQFLLFILLLIRVQKEISTKLKWLERKQRAKERREAKALIRTRSTEREAKTEVVSADIPSSPAPSDIADEENFEDESTTLQRTDANQVLAVHFLQIYTYSRKGYISSFMFLQFNDRHFFLYRNALKIRF